MNSRFLMILIAVALDGLAGLSGGLLPSAFVHKHLSSLLAFAAGTLIATAFLDLLPEALSGGLPAEKIMIVALVGFLIFYLVESLLGSHATGQSGHKHSTIGPLILIGDALHNATDGVAIAAAFMASTTAGIATTVAVIVHELPQEVGDFGILLAHGYTRGRALFALFIVQLTAFIGALGALYFASASITMSYYFMAASAGGFLYIAAADLLPELQRQKGTSSTAINIAGFLFGIAIIALLHHL